jgi:hypothetical protein
VSTLSARGENSSRGRDQTRDSPNCSCTGVVPLEDWKIALELTALAHQLQNFRKVVVSEDTRQRELGFFRCPFVGADHIAVNKNRRTVLIGLSSLSPGGMDKAVPALEAASAARDKR